MDETILLWVNSHYNAFWDAYMPMLTDRFTWIPLYLALAYAIIRTLGWKRGMLFIAAIALATLFTDQICSQIIRPWAQRLRPSNELNPLSASIHIVNGYRGGSYGMPSCHAANTVGLLTLLLLHFRNRWLAATMTVWMLMQVYSRMYLGVHYPTDLLVGACIGTLIAQLIYLIYHVMTHNDRTLLKNEKVPELTFVLTLIIIGIIAC